MSLSVAGTNPLTPLPPPLSGVTRTDPETAAANRTIAAAVKSLNDSGAAGDSHELSIAIDPTTRQAIVRIIDRSTNQVVEQLPSEYLLQVARQISERIAQQLARSADKTESR